MSLFQKTSIKDFLKTIAFAIFFATIFRSFFFQPFSIPSGSMIPTLIVGDKLLVEKYSYGYSKYSLPMNMIPFNGKILDKKNPKRGHIVVFKLPERDGEHYIKRVIGLPGDKIELKNGTVYVNDKPNIREFIRQKVDGSGGAIYFFNETNADGHKYQILQMTKNGSRYEDNFAPIVVPKDHYFMMGDNRNQSSDSRFDFVSYVHRDKIVGKARFIFFSSDASIFEPWNWRGKIYTDRILDRLDKSL
jgi:signal peptidase I